MKPKTVFFKDRLFSQLVGAKEGTANYLASVEKVFNDVFPGVAFSTKIIWAILQSYELREYIRERIEGIEANEIGLPSLNPSQAVAEEQKMAIYYAKQKVRRAIMTIRGFSADNCKEVTTFLRLGIIYDKDGRLCWLENGKADALLQNYCSVTVENESEGEFVARIQTMKKALEDINNAVDFINSERAELKKIANKAFDVQSFNAFDNKETFFNWYYVEICDGIRLESDGSIWRALISHVAKYRAEDMPRFFNEKGVPEFDAVAVYQLTGFRPAATPALRVKYPELYKNVPYRGYFDSSYWGEDTAKAEKEYRQNKKTV